MFTTFTLKRPTVRSLTALLGAVVAAAALMLATASSPSAAGPGGTALQIDGQWHWATAQSSMPVPMPELCGGAKTVDVTWQIRYKADHNRFSISHFKLTNNTPGSRLTPLATDANVEGNYGGPFMLHPNDYIATGQTATIYQQGLIAPMSVTDVPWQGTQPIGFSAALNIGGFSPSNCQSFHVMQVSPPVAVI